MADPTTVLQLFPENGLDRSLHAPVYIGLMFLVFFRETLGWGFAGLVVPGYLATVLIAAPVTGALVVVEAIITYIVALLLGRMLPRTGAWFTFFGRERFLLLIASASLTRLAIEGSLLPAITSRWDLIHSRELYSLGLVLVPLLANSFWNAGFVRAFPRVSTVTGLTYLIVSELLLPYTNFTLSRFQVANESVSLAFLESPHAHIILLVGAILGARNNVRYGWDYNGILVPALLAVAWYQPSKVATTLMEALVVYYSCMWLIRRRPFSKLMFVGCRRVVLTFSVGFAIKYASGMLLVRFWPEVQLIDFFGFGYLLPSLLANKMWDRGGVAKVLMPTLQVSILAFPIGALLGYALRAFEPAPAAAQASSALHTVESVPWALLLGDSAPSPDRSGTTLRLIDPYGVALELSKRAFSGRMDEEAVALAGRGQLSIAQPPDKAWSVITPSALDPNVDVAGPRLAVRNSERYGDEWLVIVESPEVGSPAVPIAFALAERMGGRSVLLSSRYANVRARDEEFTAELAAAIRTEKVLRVSVQGRAGDVRLRAVAGLPRGVTPRVFEDILGTPVVVDFTTSARASSGSSALELSLAQEDAESIAHRLVGALDAEPWAVADDGDLARRLTELSFSTKGAYEPASIAELRVYGALLASRFFAGNSPSDWERSLAKFLGLAFARVQGSFEGYALHEPQKVTRTGHATVLVRTPRRAQDAPLALTLAAPRWEMGAVAAAVRLTEVFEADALVVHGALVNAAEDQSSDPRRPRGRQSLFQRAHETWLNAGGRSVILRGIPDSRSVSTDAVVTFDNEVNDIVDGPAWAAPLLARLSNAGVTLGALDGSAERAGFEASLDPGAAYGRRFAANRTLVLWMTGDLRDAWSRAYTDDVTERRLAAAGIESLSIGADEFVATLARCSTARTPECPAPNVAATCRRAEALDLLQRFVRSQNPYYLDAALASAAGCGWTALDSRTTRTRWLAVPPAADDRSWLMVPLIRGTDDAREKQKGMRTVSAAQFPEVSAIASAPLSIRQL